MFVVAGALTRKEKETTAKGKAGIFVGVCMFWRPSDGCNRMKHKDGAVGDRARRQTFLKGNDVFSWSLTRSFRRQGKDAF